MGGAGEFPVRKIVERFDRNPQVEADTDIRKRVNNIAMGTIALEFHFGPNRITASNRLYNKDGSEAVGWQADPTWEKPQARELRTEFHRLVAQEKVRMYNDFISSIDLDSIVNR